MRATGIQGAQLLAALGGGKPSGKPSGKKGCELRFATIDPAHAAGRPRLIFDGETVAGDRQYPYLATYTPAAGDRVLVALVNNSGVVIGKIV